MDNGCFVQSVFHFTGFGVIDRLCHVHGDRAALRVRHEAFRSQDSGDSADNAHHVRGSDADVKTKPVFVLDFGDHFFGAHKIRAGGCRLVGFCAFGDYQHFLRTAGAVRQYQHAADLLIRLFRVNAQFDVKFHRFVELGFCQLAGEAYRVFDFVSRIVYLLRGVNISFTFHQLPPVVQTNLSPNSPTQSTTTTPMLRAVPAIMLHAASREAALRSGILVLAISST